MKSRALAVIAVIMGLFSIAVAGEYWIDFLKSDSVIVYRSLGVGTASPSTSYVMDVVGNARITGNPTIVGAPSITGNPSVTGNLSVSGQMLLPSVSSTTLASLVPAAVGAVVYNNTRATICIGTATVAGAWVLPMETAIDGTPVTCKE